MKIYINLIQQMNQSDQQFSQGFESSKIIIEQQNTMNPHCFGFRPIDYSPRVLLKSRIFKKLPEQMNEPIKCIEYQPINQQLLYRNRKINEQREETDKPENIYENNNSAYRLVYSKYEEKYIFRFKEQNFTNRQISLKPILRYQQQNYYLLKPFQQNQTKNNTNSLLFDSKFECGNLLCAYQSNCNKAEYHLFMENDTNRFGYSQWFCFSVRGMQKGKEYTFKIMNMRKAFSFYKLGMKPIIFSLNRHRKTGNGWQMKGENITYNISSVHDIVAGEESKLYCLQFTVIFQESDDFVTVSAGVPYSYSRLVRSLKEFKELAQSNCIQWNQKTIAYSLSNNQVPYLIIKKNESQPAEKQVIKSKKKKDEGLDNKPIILIFARQHPGQSNSSFMMQQFLRQLASISKKQTQFLLEHYEFHIFPMLNVDGVIYGNFRCDLAGFDINRIWRNPLKQINPQIHAVVSKIRQLSQYKKIICCFDFHSHSKEYNIFSYCCKQEEIEARVLPFMMSKIYEGFSFPSCTFGLTRDKLSTARATIFSIVKHPNVLTIQCSSFARKIGNQLKLFEPKDFGEFSRGILEVLKNYLDDGGTKKDYEGEIKGRINELIAYQTQNQEQFLGSDSEEEVDPIIHVKTLDISLPENAIKKYQGNFMQIQEENTQLLKVINKKQQVVESENLDKIQKIDKTQKIDKQEKCQVKQKQKYYPRFQIKKQQILAIIRTKQSTKQPRQTPKKGEHHQIRMPFNTFKANILKYQQHNKTQTVQQDEIEVSKQQLELLQTKYVRKNRSSLILKSSTAQKDAIRALNNSKIKNIQKPQKIEPSMRFKLKSFQENNMASFDKVSSSVGDKRNTDLRRMSRIEKILRIRKRVNTLKNIINPSESKINNTNIYELKIGEDQKVESNQNTKVKHNKSSTLINNAHNPHSINEKMHIYKGNTKNHKAVISNHPNAHTSLIGQMWKINYGRYSKDLA